MDTSISLIGYGEAGRTFARGGKWAARCGVFDVKPFDALYEQDGVRPRANVSSLCATTDCILSLVSADQSRLVAEEVAQFIDLHCLFMDMNSVAPATKIASAQAIERAGGRYVDVAIMAPVNPLEMDVPLLVSGPHADVAIPVLMAFGFTHVEWAGDEIGRASTIKMLRSVMFKGVEALTAECLLACEKAGVTREVLASFKNDWSSGADYRLDRMMVHGTRRGAEMEEVVKTLDSLGIEALMTRGAAARQSQVGALAIANPPQGLEAKLERLAQI
jgi:3-hydroxyisobutyrate dehydrogenase-like beta-hydroxyacid dehydrogenase